jgi:hypothetical protein
MCRSAFVVKPRQRQTGATSLLISVLIMFLAATLIIGVSRTTTLEQRMSGNELRSRQAFTAAQAGLDHAIDYMLASPQGIDQDQDDNPDTVTPLDHVAPATYRFSYCADFIEAPCAESPTAPVCDPPALEDFSEPVIVSCGWSDDETGRRLIQQQVTHIPGIGSAPNAPAVVRSAVNVSGSATIWNYFTNLTVWTGDSLTSIGNSGKTYVRNPLLPPPNRNRDEADDDDGEEPLLPDTSKTTGEVSNDDDYCDDGDVSTSYNCWEGVTDKNSTGPDVIANDPVLAGLSDAQMFQNYLGAEDLDTYREFVADQDITAAQANTLDDGDTLGQAVVIAGNTTLPNGTIGSRDEPVVLVIDGDWTGGNVTVWGIVYVTGDIDLAGNPLVYGAVVAEGEMRGTGSLDIVYDPYTLEQAEARTGSASLSASGWRDWIADP